MPCSTALLRSDAPLHHTWSSGRQQQLLWLMCLLPQMKISFNDKSLHTTFEYPSESSLVREAEAEGEAEEEEEEEEGADVNGPVEKPFALFLPRAKFVSSVAPESPCLPDGSSGECPPVQADSPVGSLGHICVHSHVHTCAPGPAGLSSYTPKHSTAFSSWQEQALAQAPAEVEPSQKEVMVSRGWEGPLHQVWAGWVPKAWVNPC